MILEDATHEAYGYYPRDLKPKSNKRILAACDSCGKVRVTSKADYRTLCLSCSTKNDEVRRKNSLVHIGLQAGEKNGNWKGGLVKRICEFCGKGFYTKSNEIKKGWGIYCNQSCAAKARKGDNNSNWHGGISFEPYCIKFNKDYKESVRELFERKCFLCGISEEDNGRKLDVHHVNYNKDCGCDETVCICVPLCVSCHAKTNGNRALWQKLIMLKLKNTLVGWL